MIGSSLLKKANTWVEKTALSTVMGLPAPAMRAFAGKPVCIDGQELAVDTQAMLKLMRLSKQPSFGALEINHARRALIRSSRLAGGDQPIGRVEDFWVHGYKARLYTPSSALPENLTGGTAPAPAPMMVFIHGGGFIYGDVESHDAPCRFLAETSGIRVLSVNYRLGPEAKFPAAYDDCVHIFASVLDRASEFGADPTRIGVGGDSAGANLAIGVALAHRDRCAFQVLIYPTTDARHQTRSRELFAEGFFLDESFMRAAGDGYTAVDTDLNDPRLSPIFAEIPEDLAPAYLCTAGFDPLRDEGEAFARRLVDAGAQITVDRFPDQIHGFLNCVGAGATHKAAVAHIAEQLKTLATKPR